MEVPIYIVGARARWDEAFMGSAITHPVVWFGIPRLYQAIYGALGGVVETTIPTGVHYWIMFVVAESFAVVIEGLYLRWLGKKHPFLWALAANASSVALGMLSRLLFGVP
ncbi:MAG: hypothetical protein U0414_10035 [Polyangiaceae bacterium]